MATRTRPGELGVVYTPRDVAGPMVDLALAPLVANRSADEILGLRICDPAIGEGAFLVEIVRVLAAALRGRRDAARLVAERCIHGVDLDPRAVAIARAAVEQLAGGPVPALADHLRVADALATTWGAFDAVVGNPPYIRQERLRAKHALRTFASYDGVADLYVYFVELAHRIVRPGGRYCLIVPNKWMTAAYGRPLRELLAREASLEQLWDFGRGSPVFADADAFPCIIAGTIGADQARPLRAAHHHTVAAAVADHGVEQDRARWRGEPWHIDGRRDSALVDRLAARWPAFADVVGTPSRGVVTGCNRAFVLDGEARARLIEVEPAADGLLRPLVKGRDVRRWRARATERYILLVDRGTDLQRLPHVRAHLERFRTALEPRPVAHTASWPGRKPGTYKWYELQDPVGPLVVSRSPRLLYQDIQMAPACSFDPGELVPDTTVWIVPSADRFLLAVLNSSYYGWYARLRFPPALNGATRPKRAYIARLPIALPSADLRAHVVALVDAQLHEAEPARELLIDDAICNAYELSRSERALVRAQAARGNLMMKRSTPQRSSPCSRPSE